MAHRLNERDNLLLMKLVLTCTVLYYNTPVFYKVSQIDTNEYFAEALDNRLKNFKMNKRHGEWFGESETSHYLAAQIGIQIDKAKSSLTDKNIPE